jgi:hypothetical protein
MKTSEIPTPQIAVKSGLMICVAFIIYFLMMNLAGLLHMTELRFLNILILLAGLLIAYRNYRSMAKNGHIPYLDGLVLGVLTSLTAFISFSIFTYLFFSLAAPDVLMQIGKQSMMLGTSPSPLYASIAVLVEGFTSGLIMTFILMQYFKSGYYNPAVRDD